MKKVVKFGGSSLASAKQFKKVGDIIRQDKARRYVIPSAPGKRSKTDEKVTDMLYTCYDAAASGTGYGKMLTRIKERYEQIIEGLDLNLNLDYEFQTIEKNFIAKMGRDYAASRGEYLNGIIMSHYLGYEFIDAAEVIFFDDNGVFLSEKTTEELSQRLAHTDRAVIPGFYGSKPDGSIHTFSRGGSDITGSIVARAIHADLYENWTDVSGILMADPRIVDHPRSIERATYSELRQLSYSGAQVLHEMTIFPVREKNIPLNIRNTNEPDHPGTLITESFVEAPNPERFVTGIAGKCDFSIVTVSKKGLSGAVGTLRAILEVFENNSIPVAHTPSGIDCISLAMPTEALTPNQYSLLDELRSEIRPDSIQINDHIAVIAVVGRKMAFRVGTSGKIFAALGKAGINIRMISQGPDEQAIILGVDNKDYADAIRVLYNAFVK